jgi:hypothetical protein
MKVLLYTVEPPQGRCLLLAQRLQLATSLAGSECVQIAQRLFANDHPQINPMTIDVPDAESTSRLEAVCAELGILTEFESRQESVIPG